MSPRRRLCASLLTHSPRACWAQDDDGTGYLVSADAGAICIERLDGDYIHGTGAIQRVRLPTTTVRTEPLAPPSMFRRGGTFYILLGSASPGCNASSAAWAFTSSSALGSFKLHDAQVDLGTQSGAVVVVQSPDRPPAGTSLPSELWQPKYWRRFLWLGRKPAECAGEGGVAARELLFAAGGGLLPTAHVPEALLLAG